MHHRLSCFLKNLVLKKVPLARNPLRSPPKVQAPRALPTRAQVQNDNGELRAMRLSLVWES